MNSVSLSQKSSDTYFQEFEPCWGKILIHGDQNFMKNLKPVQGLNLEDNLDSFCVSQFSQEELLKWRSNDICYDLEHLKNFIIGVDITALREVNQKEHEKIINFVEKEKTKNKENPLNNENNNYLVEIQREKHFHSFEFPLNINLAKEIEPDFKKSINYKNYINEEIERKHVEENLENQLNIG
jgi:hypothetical protein